MADQDTDRWVFEVLAPHLRRKMKNLKNDVQWTDLVYVFDNDLEKSCLLTTRLSAIIFRANYHHLNSAQSLREVHGEGKTRTDIENALRCMPFVRPTEFTNNENC